jgi:hypothetical protein
MSVSKKELQAAIENFSGLLADPVALYFEQMAADSGGRSAPPSHPAHLANDLKIYQLKISLVDVAPAVTRTIEARGDASLEVLAGLITRAFGWSGAGQWQFKLGGRYFGAPSEFDIEPVYTAGQYRLSGFVSHAAEARDLDFTYLYDFVDAWEHRIEVAAIFEADPGATYPRCSAGERAAPPEKSGGAAGYRDCLRILDDATHPLYAEFRALAPDGFDPERFDLAAADAALR